MALSIQEIRASKSIAVIDGNSLMHRAFHAVPATMSSPDGRPTNACFGFVSMLLRLIEDYVPDAIVCAFDKGKPAFRMEIIQQYKAQRPPTDPLLKQQFPMMQVLLESMNIPVLFSEGWEGDDILGTVAAQAEEMGYRVLLVTGDKDAMQLVDDNTCILRTLKGTSDMAIFDEEAVYQKYAVGPDQIPDLLGLMGDSSDNIPGVDRIGEKTAAKLLSQFGSIDGIYQNLDKVTGKNRDYLEAGRQSAYDSRKVATISREAPVQLDLSGDVFPAIDPAAIRKAFGDLGMRSQQNKVINLAMSMAPGAVQESVPDDTFSGPAGSGAACITSPLLEGEAALSMIDFAIAAAEELAVFPKIQDSLDIFGSELELCIAGSQGIAHLQGDSAEQALLRILCQGRLVALDAKGLIQHLYPADSSLVAAIGIDEIAPERTFDISLAAYLLNSSKSTYTVEELLGQYLNQPLPQVEFDDKPFAHEALYAACLRTLAPVLQNALIQDRSADCYRDIELPLLPVLLQMERCGMDVDCDKLKTYSQQSALDLDEIRLQIYRLAGEEFNVDSPKQLAVILFDKLKLPPLKKTKTGYSTDASVLSELAKGHPLPAKVIEYREIAKIKSTYMDALPALLDNDGRLHTHLNQSVTATGRLSSSEPNLQNIPVRSEFGRRIRSAFLPKDEGWVFLTADYSQIELRLLAHFSEDPRLMAAFRNGEDFHRATAAGIFDVAPEAVDAAMRSKAKAVNFGIVYGQQAFGLARSLDIPFKEAQEMIDRYFEAYPGVSRYLQAVIEDCCRDGYAQSISGRKRRIPDIMAGNNNLRKEAERTAMNHPMQGSAADIIKLAMIEVQKRLNASALQARLCLQVHDELDFECPATEVEALSALVKDAMENVMKLRVPLEVSVAVGPTWAEAK